MAKLTRILVYEGNEEWIRQTLLVSVVQPGDIYQASHLGTIKELSREWEDSLEVKPVFSTNREIAKAKGFTGDSCVMCGGLNMKRNGNCLMCSDCGETTGCS